MKFMRCAFFLWLIPIFVTANQVNTFEENGKVGLKNDQGQILIPAQYEALGWPDGSVSVIAKVTGYKLKNHWGLISIDNHRITKAEFTELQPAENALFVARKKSNLSMRLAAGCIHASGKEVIPFIYDGIRVSSLRAIVFIRTGNQFNYGMIDLTNKVLIPLQYRSIYPLGSLRYAVENFEGKISIFTDVGKQMTDFSIDSISAFKKNHAVFFQHQKQGVIDRDGIVKIEARYREVIIQDDNSVRAREPDEWSILDGQNQVHQRFQADSISPAAKKLLKVAQAGQVTLTDLQFKMISPPFSLIGNFHNGRALVKKHAKIGLIKTNGDLALEPRYEKLHWTKSYIRACLHVDGCDKWILLDSMGQQKSQKLYDRLENFNGSFFPVQHKGYWGGMDEQGKETIACVFDSIVQQKKNYVVVGFKGQYGIISLREEWIITPQSNPLTIINLDRYSERIGPTTFIKSFDKNIIYFSDNHLEIKEDFILEYLPSGTIWKIDMNGRIVDRQVHPEEPTEKIFPESEGLRGIQRNGKFGFVDARGRLRIANRYENIKPFSEELAAAMVLGKWGFINHDDKIAIQPTYEDVTSFKDGYSMVKQKGAYGLIDKKGNQVLPARHEKITVLPTGRLLIQQEGLLGLADSSGKILINPKYNHLDDLNTGYVIIGWNGKFGLITLQGISTIPLLYDGLLFNTYDQHFLAVKRSSWVKLEL